LHLVGYAYRPVGSYSNPGTRRHCVSCCKRFWSSAARFGYRRPWDPHPDPLVDSIRNRRADEADGCGYPNGSPNPGNIRNHDSDAYSSSYFHRRGDADEGADKIIHADPNPDLGGNATAYCYKSPKANTNRDKETAATPNANPYICSQQDEPPGKR
jgi:hypothetical protein